MTKISWVILIVSLGTLSHAAEVQWSVENFTSTAQVTNSGTLITALNLGGVADVSMNGVNFTVGNIASGSASENYFEDTAFSIAGLSVLEQNSLLDSINYVPGAGQSLVPVDEGSMLNALTSGQDYLIQFIVCDYRSATKKMDFGYDTVTDGIDWNLQDVNIGSEGPKIVTGIFTADDTQQLIYGQVDEVGQLNFISNAYQIRAIPEPSVALLLGTAAAGMFIIRRMFLI